MKNEHLIAVTAEELQAEISQIQRFVKGVRHFAATSEVKGLVFPPTSTYQQIGEWMYYNFAAGSFLSKKLCSKLHSIEVDFYSKNRQIGDFDPI